MLQDNKAEKKKNAKGDNNEKEIVTSEIEFVDNDTFNVICKVTQDDGTICNAKLRLDMRLYPGDDAKANPVGEARSDSNMQPFLPPPIGRISFSLNPFAMLVSSFCMLTLYRVNSWAPPCGTRSRPGSAWYVVSPSASPVFQW